MTILISAMDELVISILSMISNISCIGEEEEVTPVSNSPAEGLLTTIFGSVLEYNPLSVRDSIWSNLLRASLLKTDSCRPVVLTDSTIIFGGLFCSESASALGV